MKIGIDISQAVYETGVAVYTREISSALVKNHPEHQYVLYGGSMRRVQDLQGFVKSLGKNTKDVTTPISPTVADFIWNRLHTFPVELLVGKCDVFHTSDWTEPPSKIPKVTTIHDFTPFKFPKETHPRVVAAHTRRLSWVKKESSAVIVPSLATKNDTIEYGIDEKIIHIIPEAPRSIYKKVLKSEIDLVMSKYNIRGPYALTIGRAKRKNLERTINAFVSVRKKAGLETLVVVGGEVESGATGVTYLGHIPSTDLVALNCGATVMLYASLYEGFGLPILESYACGCPVVTSNISSMPEVAGNAAALVDPYSVSSIADGILTSVLKSSHLITKGFSEVKKYTWKQAARQTLEVYKQITRL